MKIVSALVIGVVVVMVACGAWVLAAQQKPASADVLLGQALHQEQNEGRLEDAIASYKKVLAAADATREQKARAQFRIGACYERLGAGEARKAYEAVVANYGDQPNLVAQAKARLAALTSSAGRASGGGPVIRQIWATSEGVSWNRVSPDGRFVAGIDDETGDLVTRSLATGEIRRLTSIPKDRWGRDYADSPVWSRDGRQIAYGWYSPKRPAEPDLVELRVATLADGTSRVVPTDARFRPYSPADWSPDGRSVLTIVADASPNMLRFHQAWVNTSAGTVRLLASGNAGDRIGPAFLAPNGAWIVSRILTRDAGFSIMAAGGGPPRTLIPAPSSDSLVGWSPDGTHVLFISRERGSDDLMALRVVDGQAVGQPFLIRAVQAFSSLGIAQSGALLCQSGPPLPLNVYRASFDATSGRVGPPSRADLATLHENGSVSWSPDGRRLAYVSWAKGKSSRTLSILSDENAQTRSFSLPFSAIKWGWHRTTWSADGRWVYAAGYDDTERAGVYRISSESGTVEDVLPPESGLFQKPGLSDSFAAPAAWSPDARAVYKMVTYLKNGVPGPVGIVEHRIADHAERELFKSGTTRAGMVGLVVSPDGSQLAFTLIDYADPANQMRTLTVMPTAGGTAKTIATLPSAGGARINWTPDGRSLVFPASRQAARGEPWLCDVATGAVTKLAMAPDVLEIAMSPGGKEIVYIGGLQGKDDGVWMLENFLPPTKGKAAPPKK